jgi:C1A family cysteine protease
MSARLLTIAAIATAALAMPIVENLHDRAYYEEKFFNWMSEHKIEAKNADHFVKMIQNFANNDDAITRHNNQNLSWTMGHNQFSHMDVEEWSAYVRLGLKKPVSEEAGVAPVPSTSANPATVDWRNSGAVTGVKDQGSCGSCWSFSTTGSIEGAHKIKTGTLTSYSEQNLVDCDKVDGACDGGWMDDAFTWAKKNGGLCTEAAYPYVGKEQTCKTTCAKDSGAAPVSFTDVPASDAAAFETAVAKQPVSVAIDATTQFQLYKSGVFSSNCGTALNHGVLTVGYTSDAWIVKNSWGTSWGEQGYIRLARSAGGKDGQCGIYLAASYPNM